MPNAVINQSTAASNQIIAAPSDGKHIQIWNLVIIAGGTVNITLQDGSTALTGAIPLTSSNGFSANAGMVPLFDLSPNTAFNILSGQAVQISGWVSYSIG